MATVRHSPEEIGGQLRQKEPKNECGPRQVALPQMAVDAPSKRRAAAMTEGVASSPFAFPDSTGGPLRKCNFHRKVWSPIRAVAKLTGKHIHDLRHSCASMLLANGVNVKAIQSILGHSTISMTMDTHAHRMPGAPADAANRFDRLLAVKLG